MYQGGEPAANRTQHDDFARAGVGTESHFRVEKGVRLTIIGSGIHPT